MTPPPSLLDAAQHDSHELRRRDWVFGLVFCLLFCVAAVMLRGVRWDETWEYAQTMTGKAPYPEGHPMLRYTFGAYSLPNYVSAGMLWIGLGPEWICGFRNVLFLFATVSPVFLITSVLARNMLWGCVAALLALEGIYLEFDGSYPLMTWPELYSNGHIGGGWALFSLGLLMAGFPEAAFLLTGLMPCIHVGQIMPLFLVAALYLFSEALAGNRASVKRLLAWFLAGLAVSVFFLAVQKTIFAAPAPTSGPYFSNEDPHALWQSYTAYHDIHRQPPPGNGQVIVIGMILLSAGAAYLETRYASVKGLSLHRRPFLILLAYSAIIGAIVWGAMLLNAISGGNLPFFLVGWMPYRLVNHIGPLLLCAVIGILCARKETQGIVSSSSVFVLGAIVYYLVLPLLPHVAGSSIWSRYLAKGDGLLFALYGAALGRIAAINWESTLGAKGWLIVSGLALAALAGYHHFGAACAAAGLTLSLLACGTSPRLTRLAHVRATPGVAAALCAVLALVICGQQWQTRRSLPASDFDRRISEYLREQGDPGAMLAGPPDEFMLQARTGHPVFAEAATASYLTYMPELGPVFQKMLFDMYGLRYGRTSGAKTTPWQDLWRARTREEWQRLASEYSFEYVIVYDSMPLDLPLAFRDGTNALYQVPR